MKGIILAGGTGSRLSPLTKVTNKHLLPIYNKPMIYYPLQTLIDAGLEDILIVSGPGHAGHFLNLLGSGKEFGIRLTYEVQDEAGGIAQALGLASDFADDESVAVILGDNIFEDSFHGHISTFNSGAKLFLKAVPNPQRFGVAEIVKDKLVQIQEKPAVPKSDLAVTGFYIYDSDVFDIIPTLTPSARKELEITDVNNAYIRNGKIQFAILPGYWSDAGTFESLVRATELVRNKILEESKQSDL
ncbi:MAG: sugar phosphate nucleotidyltransferase [Candidatus Heimdallarchaeota archaeon]